jgi:cob(I)alamin adenosyltransferase
VVRIYTRRGDDGTTGLLYGGRVSKADLRTEVYGTLDETTSALGLARAFGLVPRVNDIVVRLQREMFVVGAQLATAPENQSKLSDGVSRITPAMTERTERDIDELLDLARATLRRAERRAVELDRSGLVPDAEILRYLNRASDLLYALARFEEAERGLRAPSSRTS